MTDEERLIVSQKVRARIAIAITVLWALSVVSSIVAFWLGRSLDISPWVGVTMLGTSAAVFGSGFVAGMRGQE